MALSIPAKASITTTSLALGKVGSSYYVQLNAAGGIPPYTWTLATGTLPACISLSSSGMLSSNNNVLASCAGTSSLTFKVTDSGTPNPLTDSASFSLVLGAAPAIVFNGSIPTIATTGAAYDGSAAATGGVGPLTYTLSAGALPAGLTLNAASGVVTGSPTATGSSNFTVKVSDAYGDSEMYSFEILVSNPEQVSLSAVNPHGATVNQFYSTTITASGGVGPYSWSINGAAVTDIGLSLANGLSASNSGTIALAISGTPTTTDTITLTNVHVVDSLNSTATQTYAIAVHPPGAQVSGSIDLRSSYCATGHPLFPPITVTIDTTPSMQTTTDAYGFFTFYSVPNGTFTVTPSMERPPAGPSSVFYPTSEQVTVSNAQEDALRFSVALGYTVSGTVAYHGANTGQTYLNLVANCGSYSGIGTSLSPDALSSGGAFTLHGVPPGNFTLQAWMDPSTLGNGAQNVSDPAGRSASVNVSTKNITGISVTMTDPAVTAQSAGPKLNAVTPTNLGALISYDAGSVTDQTTGQEVFSSYNVQWSTGSTFTGTPSSATFKAVGTGYAMWMLNNGNSGTNGTLPPDTAYYFRVRGTNSAGSSDWVYWGGNGNTCSASNCAIAVTIGEPTGSAYATVTGTVNITSEMAPLINGPLYVGYFDPKSGTAYGYVVPNPILGDNGYSISVLKSPTTGYVPFGILDQNKDGVIDAGDVTNFVDNPPPVTINGSTTGLIELSYLYELPRVQTHYILNFSFINGMPQTGRAYILKFVHIPGNKLPVSVQLTAGPHVVAPMDIGNYCQGCSYVQFSNSEWLADETPALGDTYTFSVTFSDGTVMDESAQIVPFGGTTQVTGAADLPTHLFPSSDLPGQTQPTFSWTYPTFQYQTANPTTYEFQLCTSGDNVVLWQVPSFRSGRAGFTENEIPGPLAWGIDPLDSNNKPSVTTLTTGTRYWWQIQAQDEFGNVATRQTAFIPDGL